ncbi:MAG TPA: hypothetical protein VLA88_02700 [Candidatus Saccharimonadales bacterium]|nr:hypothetical protein [Candidatus Saccharimonadales bacterium]
MRKRLRKLFKELIGIVGALSAGLGAFFGLWFIWGEHIKELFRATRHVTVHSVVWAGAAIVVIAGVVRLAEKRYDWLRHSTYYVISRWLRGRLQRGARALDQAFSGEDRKYGFLSLYIHNLSDHWLAQKVEEWGVRILYIIFWPVVIVAGTHAFQDDIETTGGYAITIVIMVLVWAVVGAKLRNMALLVGIAGWLSYTALTQGDIEAEAQAAVIGASFVLWAGWREWNRRIATPPPGAEPGDGDPLPKPAT